MYLEAKENEVNPQDNKSIDSPIREIGSQTLSDIETTDHSLDNAKKVVDAHDTKQQIDAEYGNEAYRALYGREITNALNASKEFENRYNLACAGEIEPRDDEERMAFSRFTCNKYLGVDDPTGRIITQLVSAVDSEGKIVSDNGTDVVKRDYNPMETWEICKNAANFYANYALYGANGVSRYESERAASPLGITAAEFSELEKNNPTELVRKIRDSKFYDGKSILIDTLGEGYDFNTGAVNHIAEARASMMKDMHSSMTGEIVGAIIPKQLANAAYVGYRLYKGDGSDYKEGSKRIDSLIARYKNDTANVRNIMFAALSAKAIAEDPKLAKYWNAYASERNRDRKFSDKPFDAIGEYQQGDIDKLVEVADADFRECNTEKERKEVFDRFNKALTIIQADDSRIGYAHRDWWGSRSAAVMFNTAERWCNAIVRNFSDGGQMTSDMYSAIPKGAAKTSVDAAFAEYARRAATAAGASEIYSENTKVGKLFDETVDLGAMAILMKGFSVSGVTRTAGAVMNLPARAVEKIARIPKLNVRASNAIGAASDVLAKPGNALIRFADKMSPVVRAERKAEVTDALDSNSKTLDAIMNGDMNEAYMLGDKVAELEGNITRAEKYLAKNYGIFKDYAHTIFNEAPGLYLMESSSLYQKKCNDAYVLGQKMDKGFDTELLDAANTYEILGTAGETLCFAHLPKLFMDGVLGKTMNLKFNSACKNVYTEFEKMSSVGNASGVLAFFDYLKLWQQKMLVNSLKGGSVMGAATVAKDVADNYMNDKMRKLGVDLGPNKNAGEILGDYVESAVSGAIAMHASGSAATAKPAVKSAVKYKNAYLDYRSLTNVDHAIQEAMLWDIRSKKDETNVIRVDGKEVTVSNYKELDGIAGDANKKRAFIEGIKKTNIAAYDEVSGKVYGYVDELLEHAGRNLDKHIPAELRDRMRGDIGESATRFLENILEDMTRNTSEAMAQAKTVVDYRANELGINQAEYNNGEKLGVGEYDTKAAEDVFKRFFGVKMSNVTRDDDGTVHFHVNPSGLINKVKGGSGIVDGEIVMRKGKIELMAGGKYQQGYVNDIVDGILGRKNGFEDKAFDSFRTRADELKKAKETRDPNGILKEILPIMQELRIGEHGYTVEGRKPLIVMNQDDNGNTRFEVGHELSHAMLELMRQNKLFTKEQEDYLAKIYKAEDGWRERGDYSWEESFVDDFLNSLVKTDKELTQIAAQEVAKRFGEGFLDRIRGVIGKRYGAIEEAFKRMHDSFLRVDAEKSSFERFVENRLSNAQKAADAEKTADKRREEAAEHIKSFDEDLAKKVADGERISEEDIGATEQNQAVGGEKRPDDGDKKSEAESPVLQLEDKTKALVDAGYVRDADGSWICEKTNPIAWHRAVLKSAREKLARGEELTQFERKHVGVVIDERAETVSFVQSVDGVIDGEHGLKFVDEKGNAVDVDDVAVVPFPATSNKKFLKAAGEQLAPAKFGVGRREVDLIEADRRAKIYAKRVMNRKPWFDVFDLGSNVLSTEVNGVVIARRLHHETYGGVRHLIMRHVADAGRLESGGGALTLQEVNDYFESCLKSAPMPAQGNGAAGKGKIERRFAMPSGYDMIAITSSGRDGHEYLLTLMSTRRDYESLLCANSFSGKENDVVSNATSGQSQHAGQPTSEDSIPNYLKGFKGAPNQKANNAKIDEMLRAQQEKGDARGGMQWLPEDLRIDLTEEPIMKPVKFENKKFLVAGIRGLEKIKDTESIIGYNIAERLLSNKKWKDMSIDEKRMFMMKTGGWQVGTDGMLKKEISDFELSPKADMLITSEMGELAKLLSEYDRITNDPSLKHNDPMLYKYYLEHADDAFGDILKMYENSYRKEKYKDIIDIIGKIINLSNKYREHKKTAEQNFNGHLVDMISGDAVDSLLQMYPDFKDVLFRTVKTNEDGLLGWFDDKKNEIAMTQHGLNRGHNEVLGTLLHEVQHFIQRHEGFGIGGNEGSELSQIINYAHVPSTSNASIRSVLSALNTLLKAKKFRNRKIDNGWESHLVKNVIRPFFGDDVVDTIDAINAKKKMISTIIKASRIVRENREKYKDDSEDKKSISEIMGKAYTDYTRLIGEVEARNVQKRHNINNRRELLFEETQDVDTENQIDTRDFSTLKTLVSNGSYKFMVAGVRGLERAVGPKKYKELVKELNDIYCNTYNHIYDELYKKHSEDHLTMDLDGKMVPNARGAMRKPRMWQVEKAMQDGSVVLSAKINGKKMRIHFTGAGYATDPQNAKAKGVKLLAKPRLEYAGDTVKLSDETIANLVGGTKPVTVGDIFADKTFAKFYPNIASAKVVMADENTPVDVNGPIPKNVVESFTEKDIEKAKFVKDFSVRQDIKSLNGRKRKMLCSFLPRYNTIVVYSDAVGEKSKDKLERDLMQSVVDMVAAEENWGNGIDLANKTKGLNRFSRRNSDLVGNKGIVQGSFFRTYALFGDPKLSLIDRDSLLNKVIAKYVGKYAGNADEVTVGKIRNAIREVLSDAYMQFAGIKESKAWARRTKLKGKELDENDDSLVDIDKNGITSPGAQQESTHASEMVIRFYDKKIADMIDKKFGKFFKENDATFRKLFEDARKEYEDKRAVETALREFNPTKIRNEAQYLAYVDYCKKTGKKPQPREEVMAYLNAENGKIGRKKVANRIRGRMEVSLDTGVGKSGTMTKKDMLVDKKDGSAQLDDEPQEQDSDNGNTSGGDDDVSQTVGPSQGGMIATGRYDAISTVFADMGWARNKERNKQSGEKPSARKDDKTVWAKEKGMAIGEIVELLKSGKVGRNRATTEMLKIIAKHSSTENVATLSERLSEVMGDIAAKMQVKLFSVSGRKTKSAEDYLVEAAAARKIRGRIYGTRARNEIATGKWIDAEAKKLHINEADVEAFSKRVNEAANKIANNVMSDLRKEANVNDIKRMIGKLGRVNGLSRDIVSAFVRGNGNGVTGEYATRRAEDISNRIFRHQMRNATGLKLAELNSKLGMDIVNAIENIGKDGSPYADGGDLATAIDAKFKESVRRLHPEYATMNDEELVDDRRVRNEYAETVASWLRETAKRMAYGKLRRNAEVEAARWSKDAPPTFAYLKGVVTQYADNMADYIRQHGSLDSVRMVKSVCSYIDKVANAKHAAKQGELNVKRKFDPVMQNYWNMAKKAMNMKSDKVDERLNAIRTELDWDYGTLASAAASNAKEIDADEIMRKRCDLMTEYNCLMKYGALVEKSVGEIHDVFEKDIAPDLAGAADEFTRITQEKLDGYRHVIGAMTKELNAFRDRKGQTFNALKNNDVRKSFVINSIADLFKRMEAYLHEGSDAYEAVEKFRRDMSLAHINFGNFTMNWETELRKAVKKIYGKDFEKVVEDLSVKDEKYDEFSRSGWELSEDKSSARKGKPGSNNLPTRLSKANLIYIYLARRQDDMQENNRIYGCDDAYIQRIIECLDEKDLALANWITNAYDTMRDQISHVSERITGLRVKSPTELYCPLEFIHDKVSGDSRMYSANPFPTFLTRRTSHDTARLNEAQDVLRMFENRIQDAGHYIAFGEIIENATMTFKDSKVQNAYANLLGTKAKNDIYAQMSQALMGDRRDAGGMLNGVRNFITATSLFGNVGSAMKQLEGCGGWAIEMGVVPFLKGLVVNRVTSSEVRQGMRELDSSGIFRIRGEEGISEAMVALANSMDGVKNGPISHSYNWYKRHGMDLTKFVDRFASKFMAAQYYTMRKKFYIDKSGGKYTPEQAAQMALADTDYAIQTTQQSGRAEFFHYAQRSGVAGKLLTQFSGPSFVRWGIEVEALHRAFVMGDKGAKRQLLSKMIALHLVCAPILAMASSLSTLIFKEDDDDTEKLRQNAIRDAVVGMINGPMTGWFIWGQIMNAGTYNAYNIAAGEKIGRSKHFEVPIFSKLGSLQAATSKFAEDVFKYINWGDVNHGMADDVKDDAVKILNQLVSAWKIGRVVKNAIDAVR